MRYKNIYTKLASLFAACVIAVSCTDLEAYPFYQLTSYNFYQNRDQVWSAVLRHYTQSNAWAGADNRGINIRSEFAADQLTIPEKGIHTANARWRRLHFRSWATGEHDDTIWEPWRLAWAGVGFTNFTIRDFQTVVDWERVGMTEYRDPFIAELRAGRAWAHMRLLDAFGDIPIVRGVAGLDNYPARPSQRPRAEVWEWVEQEFLDVLADIPLLSRYMTGRISRAGVYAMLVDLYLNAEVWTGTPRWDRVIYFSNRLINGHGGGLNGPMQLDADNLITFANNNNLVSREAIFQIAYNRNQMWIGRGTWGARREQNILNSRDNGNNYTIVQPHAFFAYCERDLRRTNWFMYGIGEGRFQAPFRNIGTGRDHWDYVLGQDEFNNLPLIFAYKPMKAWYTVSDGRITIERWESPEFPGDDAKALVESALNGNTTRQFLILRYNAGTHICRFPGPSYGLTYVYLSGSTNPNSSGRGMYDWTNRSDYRYMIGDGAENIGARIIKYYIGPHTSPHYGNNHMIIYRLSWIKFAKAEALMRQNGGVATQEAVDLINSVKQRAFCPDYWNSPEAIANGTRYTVATLTMDELLAERGREFIKEFKRRQDLIRFNKWEFGIPGWFDSPNSGYGHSNVPIATGSHTRVFAIPYRAMEANPNLVQNPGYD